MSKAHATIGCCGILCGLCPRFYTVGSSQCPGCGGEGFEGKHPSCSNKTCCADRHGLEICSQCVEFPCIKYADSEKIERDSFVTHKRIFSNHALVRAKGFASFVSEVDKRVSLLERMLADFDDGRNRSFYCLAAALLSPEALHSAVSEISAVEADRKGKAKVLRAILTRHANNEGLELMLTK